MSKDPYRPPYSLTPTILRLVAEISEVIGRYTALADSQLTPRLRRQNRIRTIQASLAIENNTLTLEQVTAVLDAKRVLAEADKRTESTPFIEFILQTLLDAIKESKESLPTDQVSDQVSDQVNRLLI